MSKAVVLAVVLILIAVGAAAVVMNPQLKKEVTSKIGVGGETTATSSQPQAGQTSGAGAETGAQQQGGTQSTTTSPGGGAGEASTQSPPVQEAGNTSIELPQLAVNVSLEDLDKIVEQAAGEEAGGGENSVQSGNGQPLTGSQCSLDACMLVVEYYDKVKAEDLNLTPLFDTSIVDADSLIEMHKALYEKFDMVKYTITWLGDPEEYSTGIPEGYSLVYAVKYVINTTYKDSSGNLLRTSSKLLTFVGLTDNGTLKILQTVPLEAGG